MTTTFRLNGDELDQNFLEKLRHLFAHKEIEISVSEFDETDFALSDPEERKRLLQSIEHINNREGLIEFDPKSFR